MSTGTKALIAMGICLATAAGFYFTTWQKQWADCQHLEALAVERQQEYQTLRQETAGLSSLVAENESLRQRLTSLVRGKLSGHETATTDFVPDMLQRLEQQTASDSLRVTTFTPGQSAHSEATQKTPSPLAAYPRRQFNVRLEGDYPTMVAFLDHLAELSLHRLVTVDSLTLSPAGVSSTGRPRLTVSVPLTAYLKTGGN